jgi:hypothetical protein
MSQASTWIAMSPELQKVAVRVLWGLAFRESQPRKSRMVEISKYGSGEGPGRATGRGYSTRRFWVAARCATCNDPTMDSRLSTGNITH